MVPQPINFIRPRAIFKKRGKGRSAGYVELAKGLLPEFVPLGARAVGLPEHEVDAINAAWLAGKSEDEIRALVKRLEAARTVTNMDMAA